MALDTSDNDIIERRFNYCACSIKPALDYKSRILLISWQNFMNYIKKLVKLA